MEINPMPWGLAALWGTFLGCFYFGGLWLTLKRVHRTRRPKIWLGASYACRLLLVLAGFFAVLKRGPEFFVITFAAFLLIRFLLIRFLGRQPGRDAHAHQP